MPVEIRVFTGISGATIGRAAGISGRCGAKNIELTHDPEKWIPVFRKDHAQTMS
jgi:hypothetical protein